MGTAQLYGALSLVVPMPTSADHDPVTGVGLDRAIRVSDGNGSPNVLGRAVFRAWQNMAVAVQQEPAEMWVAQTGGPLVPDPRDEDLVDLSSAEMLFLGGAERPRRRGRRRIWTAGRSARTPRNRCHIRNHRQEVGVMTVSDTIDHHLSDRFGARGGQLRVSLTPRCQITCVH